MPFTYWREDDLSHVNSAISRCAEQILAATRQSASCASRQPWGILIEHSEPTRRELQYSGARECCHLLDQIELVPDLGVYVLLNRRIGSVPAGRYTAVCAWYHRLTTAQFLWTECLDSCGYDRHVTETSLALKLVERPSNDQRPGFSRTRHGTLWRLDPALSPAAQKYFFLEEIMEPTGPRVISLGGDTHLVFARSSDLHEPLRIMIVQGQWNSHMAAKELTRWLKEKPKEISLK